MSKARKQKPFYYTKQITLADGSKEWRDLPRNRAAIRAYYSNAQINARKKVKQKETILTLDNNDETSK